MNIKKICLVYSALLILSACASMDTHQSPSESINQKMNLADQDGDGVINERDICPDTTLGIMVTNKGCAIFTTVNEIKEITIFFKRGSTNIDKKYANQLKEYPKYIAEHDNSSIFVEGHTSNIGSKAANEKLQLQRANAVKEALIFYGANPDKIKIFNQGQHTKPVDNRHDAADAVNQRVYVKIVKVKSEELRKWKLYSDKEPEPNK